MENIPEIQPFQCGGDASARHVMARTKFLSTETHHRSLTLMPSIRGQGFADLIAQGMVGGRVREDHALKDNVHKIISQDILAEGGNFGLVKFLGRQPSHLSSEDFADPTIHYSLIDRAGDLPVMAKGIGHATEAPAMRFLHRSHRSRPSS